MGTSSIYHQEFTRLSSLAEKFFAVRKKTEELCLPLDLEDYNLSVTEDTSPPKWHLAHTSWFFERFLLEKFKHNYELALDYKERGMSAYSKLQEEEFAFEKWGYTAAKHQREVGTGYFDQVSSIITGGCSSTMAYADSTESEQIVQQ